MGAFDFLRRNCNKRIRELETELKRYEVVAKKYFFGEFAQQEIDLLEFVSWNFKSNSLETCISCLEGTYQSAKDGRGTPNMAMRDIMVLEKFSAYEKKHGVNVIELLKLEKERFKSSERLKKEMGGAEF